MAAGLRQRRVARRYQVVAAGRRWGCADHLPRTGLGRARRARGVRARAESVVILRERIAGLGASDADRLAAELGDLPLAVAQAAGFMAETGMPATEYLQLLQTRAGQLLAQTVPGTYPRSLAAATQVTVAKLAQEDSA